MLLGHKINLKDSILNGKKTKKKTKKQYPLRILESFREDT